MLTLLSSLLGLFSSALPDLLKYFQDKQDKAHELDVMKLQMEMQAAGASQRLDEINANADIAETTALYKTYTTGVHWVDALNGTVRPVIAYSFFILYAFVKYNQITAMPWQLWTEDDQIIFSGIISFYFGSRAMSKIRAGK